MRVRRMLERLARSLGNEQNIKHDILLLMLL